MTPTPEERADKITSNIHSVNLKVEYTCIPDGPMLGYVAADGYIPILHKLIADQIREAEQAAAEADRWACAKPGCSHPWPPLRGA